MNSKYFLSLFPSIILAQFAFAESRLTISGIQIGGNQCGDGTPARIIVESGHLTLLDTVVSESTFVPMNKHFPMRELDVSGYIVCQQGGSIPLDAIVSKDPTQRESIDLGHKVKIILSSAYIGENSRKMSDAVETELAFKKFAERERRKKLGIIQR